MKKTYVSLLVATLVTRLTKQLTVLLLRHTLAALLNDGAHGGSSLFVDLNYAWKSPFPSVPAFRQ